MLNTPVPACSIRPLLLFNVTASRPRLLLLTAIRPLLLSRRPVAITVLPCPVCTISPLVLSSLATCKASWPALSCPLLVLTSACALPALAVIDSKPGVVTTAPLVTTLPCKAVKSILAALVWLLLTSSDAPCKMAWPAARFCPLAVIPCVVVKLKSPLVARLPSALIPAPSKPVLAMLPACTLVLPNAASEPLLFNAPPTVHCWFLPAYSRPVLLRSPAILAVRSAPALSTPCVLRTLAASSTILPVLACSMPLLLSSTPALSAISCAAAITPSLLFKALSLRISSELVEVIRPLPLLSILPACTCNRPLAASSPAWRLSRLPLTVTLPAPVPVCNRCPAWLSSWPTLTANWPALRVPLAFCKTC